jgi:hypothetical protein
MTYHRSFMPQLLRLSSVCVFAVLFELRFMWYPKPFDAWLLRGGLLVGILAILSLWYWYRSRVLVAILSMTTLSFPQFVGLVRTDSRVGYWIAAILVSALMAAVTPARQGDSPSKERA